MADTVWSAFTNIEMEEWEYYLNYRKYQGFNVLQINILPQWDAVTKDDCNLAFKRDERGNIDYQKINESYFIRAKKMLELAHKKGFELALVALWANYVPDNWCSSMNGNETMPLSCIRPYIKYISGCFEVFTPVYLASGDAALQSESEIEYYKVAIKALREFSPKSLISMHLAGSVFIDNAFIKEDLLDFYMFQSGHGFNEEGALVSSDPSLLAEKFWEIGDYKPIVNGEPCYEGIYSKFEGGRKQLQQVRKASWISVLSGASAGISYGAHGIWQWTKKDSVAIKDELYGNSFSWKEAIKFAGANEISMIKKIFETYNLFGIEPIQIDEDRAGTWIATAKNKDRIILYISYAKQFLLPFAKDEYNFVMLAFDEKDFFIPETEVKDEKTIIRLSKYNCDAILIGEIRSSYEN